MYSVVASDSQTYGPVDAATLRLWCAEGRVSPDTPIIDADTGMTCRAADMEALRDLFPPSAQEKPAPHNEAPQMSPPTDFSSAPSGTYYRQGPAPTAPSNGLAVAGLVLGIISLVVFCSPLISFPCAALALIFGGLTLKTSSRKMAIAGMICAGIAILVDVLFIIFAISVFSVSSSFPR